MPGTLIFCVSAFKNRQPRILAWPPLRSRVAIGGRGHAPHPDAMEVVRAKLPDQSQSVSTGPAADPLADQVSCPLRARSNGKPCELTVIRGQSPYTLTWVSPAQRCDRRSLPSWCSYIGVGDSGNQQRSDDDHLVPG
jgi:hypothetical protein